VSQITLIFITIKHARYKRPHIVSVNKGYTLRGISWRRCEWTRPKRRAWL